MLGAKFILLWFLVIQSPDGSIKDLEHNFGRELTYQECMVVANAANKIEITPKNGDKILLKKFLCVEIPPKRQKDGIPT